MTMRYLDYTLKKIGNGRFGKAFEIVEHKPPAVIKFMICSSEENLLIFTKECEILAKLRHPNIIQMLSKHVSGGKNFGIITEFCERGTLRNAIFHPQIVYTMKCALLWAEQLFDASRYMFEEHHVIHRDISPSNIFVTKAFTLKIGDFGCGKSVDQTQSGSYVGTARYMSPPPFNQLIAVEEQIKNSQLSSHRNDVYGLGLVLWMIFERRLVFSDYGKEGKFSRDIFLTDVILQRLLNLELSECQGEIQNLVKNCTNFDYSKRPKATDVCQHLETIKKTHHFLMGLDDLPTIETAQRELLRPIGAMQRLLNSRNGIKEIDSILERSDGLFFEERLCEAFYVKFQESTDIEKQEFQKRIDVILSMKKGETRQFEERCELWKELQGSKQALLDGKLTGLDEIFKMIILSDFYRQMNLIDLSFYVLQRADRHSLIPWVRETELALCIEDLEEHERTRYSTKIFFESFISSVNRQEWFLLEKDKKQSVFFKRDLTEVVDFEGEWATENRHKQTIFRTQTKSKQAQNSIGDELIYSQLKAFDALTIIDCLKETQALSRKITQYTIARFVQLDESAIEIKAAIVLSYEKTC
ncbi:unnamed protein product, partial [Mesorhabditis belari]|uniref:Protein kinase domain-containing protein n=1 Tax=Mesorhabditis belari TaxID=2138241 RepID=A0AAF3EUT8_9BILA